MAVLHNDKVSPQLVRFGVFKQGEVVSFIVQNNHSMPFEGYEQNCGCLGKITRTDTTLKCDLEANFQSGELLEAGKPIEVVTDGTNYYRSVPFGDTIKAFNINTYEYEEVSLDGMKRVDASKFNKVIPIHFLDGEQNKIYDSLGKYIDNPKKNKANVTVTFYTVKE